MSQDLSLRATGKLYMNANPLIHGANQGSFRDVERQGIPINLLKIEHLKNAASFDNLSG